MKTYLVRSAKYFVALCVLCAAIVALNLTTGFSALTFDEFLYVLFHTPRGLMMPAVVLLLALFYPRFGFLARRIEGDVEEDREQIVNALRTSGFALEREEDGELVFRAEGLLRRLRMLWDDEIRVVQYGQWIELRGIRRGVARAAYRLDSYLQMKHHA